MDAISDTFVGPEEVSKDLHVCKATAYRIIKDLNTKLVDEIPSAIVVQGRVNRAYYNKAMLRNYT